MLNVQKYISKQWVYYVLLSFCCYDSFHSSIKTLSLSLFTPSVCFWLWPVSLFVSAAVLCCCIALVCSAALLLRLLNRFPYRVEEYLLSSLSPPIHRSLTVNYKWPNKHIKIKERQHVYVLVLLPGWKLFLLTPATVMALIFIFPSSCCRFLLFLPIPSSSFFCR